MHGIKNQNTLLFSIIFPKIVPIMRQCRKMWYSQTAHRWQCNRAHFLYMLDN